MFSIKYYVFELFIFFMMLVTTNVMANPMKEKNQQNGIRSDRQIRPVFNSIIFLLAANLVAKGVLGLGAYQTPTIPAHIQGSLVLTVNNPQGPMQRPAAAPIVSYQPVWLPVQTNTPFVNGETSTKRPPITQHQIVNILHPLSENIDKFENEDIVNDLPQQHVVINKFNRVDDKNEKFTLKYKQGRQLEETETETEEPDVDEQSDTTEELDQEQDFPETNNSDSTESGRQAVTSTMMPTTRNMTTTRATTPMISTTMMPLDVMETMNVTEATNATGNNTNIGYGPSNGNENISITYAPPMVGANVTGNVNQTLQPPLENNNTTPTPPSNNGVYNYYPDANYGPYTGNENISITYGPPVYQKPFFSSPEDTFLNSHNQQPYENYPTTYYNQFSDFYNYNDILNRFYKNYNYPSFYGNYLNKQVL